MVASFEPRGYGEMPYKPLASYGSLPYNYLDGVFLMASTARSIRSKPGTQTERLEARVDHEQKAFFQRAASLRGVSLKEFMVASMREAAVRTIEEHELVLSAKEQRIFVDMLMNPPKPNDALRAAAGDYLARLAG
jgi:uncharacterized protein (DUF1778 family)